MMWEAGRQAASTRPYQLRFRIDDVAHAMHPTSRFLERLRRAELCAHGVHVGEH